MFKGGTSLSKVFNVIGRFSEDIDLSLSPDFLELPEPGNSRAQADKWMKNAESVCATAVEKQIQTVLEAAAAAVLGAGTRRWFEFLRDEATNSLILLFHYPGVAPAGLGYLVRAVKLEFGSLTDQRPVGRHSVTPWIVEELRGAFPDWECEVVALELERTFWEKATILHAEYHRPADRRTPDRFSRHYADTAALAGHSSVDRAINDSKLRDRVVSWKGRFFGSSWARYDLAGPGTFRLVPPAERLAVLRADYQAMRVMYLAEPPSFDEVIDTLGRMEIQLNS